VLFFILKFSTLPGMRTVVGFDGGATKTKAVIATLDGIVVSDGIGGPSNYHVVGIEKAKHAIIESFQDAATRVNEPITVEVAVAGLAGLDCRYDEVILSRELPKTEIAKRFLVVHDSRNALYGATGGAAGAILIAGTGSVSAGTDGEGNTVRVGGWGNILDDVGSGYEIARKALTASLYSFDGRLPKTMLEDRIMEALGVESVDDIIRKIYAEKMSVTDIAALAPVVTKAAQEGDPVAARIVDEAVQGLSLMVNTVIRRLSMQGRSFPVATIGGVFKAGEIITAPLTKAINAVAPNAHIGKPMMGPWLGSVLAALEKYHSRLSPELVDAVRRTGAKVQ